MQAIIMHSINPPSQPGGYTSYGWIRAFDDMYGNPSIYIPRGSLPAYQNKVGWENQTYLEQAIDSTLNFNVSVDTSIHGVATWWGSDDSIAIVRAWANYGYHFDHWSNGSTANPDTIIVTSDLNLTAYYAIDRHSLTVNVNDETLGSVSFPLGDTADYGDTLMAVATPIAHYHVNYWEGSDIVATSADKDTIWVKMTQDKRITCRFAIDVHTVSVAPSDIVRGSVSTTGTEFEYGQPCTVEATAYTGYTFQSWSNGVTANPYTFAVTADVELTAIFLAPGEETYTVTVSVNDPTMGTATVNGNASATVISGETVTLTATANQGYRFVRWNDDNTEATRTVTVTSDMSFTAYFESIEGIDEADGQAVVIYAADGSIHIDATQPAEAAIYDMMGRHLATVATGTRTPMPTGVYMVKVGTLPAKKVVVVR